MSLPGILITRCTRLELTGRTFSNPPTAFQKSVKRHCRHFQLWHKISVKLELWRQRCRRQVLEYNVVLFASERYDSELVRFVWGFATGWGETGLFLATLPRIEKREREKEVKRESARACVSVIVTSSDPPARVPVELQRGGGGGGSGVDRDYPPGLFLVLIGGGNSLGEISPERAPLTPNRDRCLVFLQFDASGQGGNAQWH